MIMDRTIFDLNLSVEATSLYILICSNTVDGRGPTLEAILPLWNGEDEQVQIAAAELSRRGVLLNALPLAATDPLRVSNRHCWSKP